jgi:hypothetical protein
MLTKKSITVVVLVCGFCLSAVAAVSYDSIYWAPPLSVQGAKIVNAKGYVVQLKGFATMGAYPDITQPLIEHFKNDWNITVLRLPLLTSDCNCPRAICWTVGDIAINSANAAYIAAADSIVKWCEENHIYVLFDGWHEGGQGNTVGNFSSTVAAWSIMANRYKNQDNLLWEIFNEPHDVAWTTWVPMANQLIDTILAHNPVSKVIVAGTANWCQQADIQTAKFNYNQVIYSWHPYSDDYGTNGQATWDKVFGYIDTSGVAPVMATEWGFTSAADSAGYGTELIDYLQLRGMSWTGWIYSTTWGPPMLTSLNVAETTDVRNPAGNLMFNAYHVTPPVETVPVAVQQPVGGSTSGQTISINNSTIQFYCAETSPVTLSIYALNGHFVSKLIDQTLTPGSHSIRWNAKNGDGIGVTPGLYTVRLKIKDKEYYGRLNNIR